jgi:hypothetical protein
MIPRPAVRHRPHTFVIRKRAVDHATEQLLHLAIVVTQAATLLGDELWNLASG